MDLDRPGTSSDCISRTWNKDFYGSIDDTMEELREEGITSDQCPANDGGLESSIVEDLNVRHGASMLKNMFKENVPQPGEFEWDRDRVRIALAKNAGFSQNGSHMLLSLLASFCKTSMKHDKSKSTVACAIHFVSTQHF